MSHMSVGKERGYLMQAGHIAAFFKPITDFSSALPVSQHLFVFVTFNNTFFMKVVNCLMTKSNGK